MTNSIARTCFPLLNHVSVKYWGPKARLALAWYYEFESTCMVSYRSRWHWRSENCYNKKGYGYKGSVKWREKRMRISWEPRTHYIAWRKGSCESLTKCFIEAIALYSMEITSGWYSLYSWLSGVRPISHILFLTLQYFEIGDFRTVGKM